MLGDCGCSIWVGIEDDVGMLRVSMREVTSSMSISSGSLSLSLTSSTRGFIVSQKWYSSRAVWRCEFLVISLEMESIRVSDPARSVQDLAAVQRRLAVTDLGV
jgi:hypothetical protein